MLLSALIFDTLVLLLFSSLEHSIVKKNAQVQIVQSPIQFDYTTGMKSHGGHVHPADKLLPFYFTTLQFCFPTSIGTIGTSQQTVKTIHLPACLFLYIFTFFSYTSHSQLYNREIPLFNETTSATLVNFLLNSISENWRRACLIYIFNLSVKQNTCHITDTQKCLMSKI